MLKTMRKNVKTLTPVLWIVIATFVIAIFAVWGGAGRLGEANRANTLVQINSQRITADEYFQILRQRIEALKKQYPDLNTNLIKQINLPQQILEQLIQQNMLLEIAHKMGIKASDQELQEKIISYPVFQRDGKFVGFKEYKQILDWNHIPVQKFEDSLRQEIILNKVTRLLTAGVVVSEEEIWENYKNQNDTAKIEYLVAPIEKVQLNFKPTEEEIKSYFEKNKAQYRVPEKREGKYVFLKTDSLKKEIAVSDSEIEKYYKDNINQFKEPAKIKVSRIFLPYTEADKKQVMDQAQSLKNKLNSGEDFSHLAKTYSKDDKAKNGGDWGYSDWQSLSAPEIQAINKLETGQISEVIDTGNGAAIFKVTEKMPEITRSLAEVKAVIQNALLEQKARNKGSDRMENLAKIARKAGSLEQAAKREGMTVLDTGLLKNGDPLSGVDSSGALSQTLFELKDKEISSPIFTYEGVALVQLTKIEPEHQASLEEVKNQVEEDIINEKKKELTREKLTSLKLSQANNWEELAKNNNLEYKRAENHKRGEYLSLIGDTTKIDQLIFSLPLNQPSEPFEVSDGYAVVRVLERKEVSRADFDKVKAEEMDKALNQAQEMFLFSYLQKAQQELKVKINYNLFTKTTDDLLGRIGE
ncbi:MAG: peptidyl-prolyl cis-trans isomerase [Candidatus Aminicenantes bacterium]|jgi:peptidyl-prolyl cis-trans isomerase D|nr:peptidyl-prolyl cis-trans isomerase [Candidatus Aminicenantes bacterium]